MAKERYKIPTSLDASYIDLEFNLQTKDGVGPRAPVNGKTILLMLLAVIGWFYLVFNTALVDSGLFVIVLFTIVWAGLSFLLAKSDKTKRHGFELIPSLVNYLQPSNRRVDVRSFDNVIGLQGITGIDSVDPEDGMIHFMDKTVGYVFEVVGSASVLMFNEDKSMILEKVDGFYRKLPVGVEIIYDTVKESQRTDIQSASAIRGLSELKSNSPGLKKLYHEREEILRIGVGQRFKSTHQYAIVKAPKEESLSEGISLILSDVENEGLMFKQANVLNYDDVIRYVKQFYGE